MQIPICRIEDGDVSGLLQQGCLSEEQPWHPLTEVGDRLSGYTTRVQLGYSQTGLYVFVDCQDAVLRSSGLPDNADLYTEDVVEIFLWPEESKLLYFEYEISPLGSELPLLVPNDGEAFMGWLPWHYEGERRVRKAVQVRGGDARPESKIDGWSVAACIPFALLKGLGNVPPEKGDAWRGNVCRMDYDDTPRAKWTLSPDTGGEFHHYQGFATFLFM